MSARIRPETELQAGPLSDTANRPGADHLPEALSLCGIAKRFGEGAAIQGISLTLGRGEVASLLGPSGCGKTTTLRCIAGFHRPDAGSIRIGGRVVAAAGIFVPPEERGLSMVFQNYVLWPHMTAAENIGYGLRLRRLPRPRIAAKVSELMTLLGLAGLEGRYPHQMSGGQQQRVSVARSLAVDPEVLLLDEPFSNLDAKLRVEMRRDMRDLLRRLGTTAIYVTHDQEEAMALSDRIFLMSRGHIVQQGTPRQMYEQPTSRFAAAFFGFANFFPGTAERSGRSTILRLDRTTGIVPVTDTLPGARLLLAVREDGLDVSPEPQHGADWFTGRIASRLYIGGASQLSLRVAGLPVVAHLSSYGPMLWPDDAWVRIKPEMAVVLPFEPGEDLPA